MPSTSAIVGSTSIVRPQAGSIRPSACSGYFTNSGTVTMSCGVLLRQVAAVAEPPQRERRGGSRLDAERFAVVGCQHDQRAVPEALALELPDQLAEQPVHVPGLEQVALEGLIGEEGVVVGRRPVEAGVALRAGLVALPRGQVLERLVRQERVDEVERRPLARLHRGDRPAEALRPLAAREPGQDPVARHRVPAPLGVAEVAPAVVDRGQPLAQRVGRHKVGVDDARVVGQLREPGGAAGIVGPLAQAARGRGSSPPPRRASRRCGRAA